MAGSESHVSRWWREQNKRYNPELKFCTHCIKPVLWSRSCCDACGNTLHEMTEEDRRLLEEKQHQEQEEGAVGDVLSIIVHIVKQYA